MLESLWYIFASLTVGYKNFHPFMSSLKDESIKVSQEEETRHMSWKDLFFSRFYRMQKEETIFHAEVTYLKELNECMIATTALFVLLVVLLTYCSPKRTLSRKNSDMQGIAFGSLAVPLLFYTLCTKYDVPTTKFKKKHDTAHHLEFLQYSILVSSVGLTLAFGSFYERCRGNMKNPRKRRFAEVVTNTDTLGVYPERGHIVEAMMISLLFSSAVLYCLLVKSFLSQACIYTFTVLFMLNMYRPKGKNKSLSTVLNSVFGLGEWIAVTSILSFIMTTFISSNFNYGTNHLHMELIVARAGFLGCLVGACLDISWMHGIIQKIFEIDSLTTTKKFCRICFIVFTTVLALEKTMSLHAKYDPRNWNHDEDNSFVEIFLVICHPITFPRSILWLVVFLLMKCGDHEMWGCSGFGSFNIFRPTIQSLKALPNFMWLLYWILAIAILAPIAVLISIEVGGLIPKKWVVIARKYFHLVAIVLFVPPTIFAPAMMALSYAIATCVLVLVESVRVISAKKKDKRKNPSLVNEFFEAFFDEKDISHVDGAFVITHLALVIGCAAPLWTYRTMYFEKQFSIMPFLGIIVIGVGDAYGAFIGSLCGKTKWPNSKRTLEGSFAMFLSMVSAEVILRYIADYSFDKGSFWNMSLYVYLPITFLEAFTTETIDNFSLPIAAMILFNVFF
ncbi:hypothetical protein CTEN210_18574 [Chaetoceros tenuissimus]|uniref:dolichol kinase n=1 Tax=Chaetoceros tenuissimus TaxID=426638 RepID=A0AAD3DCY2_9STRA|nr:hypothetical protein CTEN210_18574 [Chaetoceros tenuissimus]